MHNDGACKDCKCNNNESSGCNCHGMMKHDWRLMKAIRTLTAVLVIIFVFWCGVQFGEIRFYSGFNRGYTTMRTGYAMPMAAYGATQAYPASPTEDTGAAVSSPTYTNTATQ